MPETSRFLVFLGAALILALTPGPGIFYVLARSLAGGRREGLLSVAGTFIGGLVHVVAAALGLSAVLVASAVAFNAVRYAGAAYLVWLGVSMIRNRDREATAVQAGPRRRNPLTQGIVTEVLNPKTALFFLSFIPQFVSVHGGHVVAQFLLLGTISVCLNSTADVIVACFAGPLGARLAHRRAIRRRQRVASGAAMIGLGVWVAAADAR